MSKILQNPIWHAANTGNKTITRGNQFARTYDRGIAIFSGLKVNDNFHLDHLHQLLNLGEESILFCDRKLNLDSRWKEEFRDGLHMMVYPDLEHASVDDGDIESLDHSHVPEMKALCELTKPGPFFDRTIDFGNYKGIFREGQLIAMSGYRLQPKGYIEISAVCTHPDHLGNGYATKLIKSQIADIQSANHIPFLHVLPSNPALGLYHKIGFKIAETLEVYAIRKQNA